MADNVTTQRSKGTVNWFNGWKGFGFITPDDDQASQDLFVHQTSIRFDGFRTLFDGQRVEFTVEVGDDGRTRASDVIPLRSHSPSSARGGVECYNCGRFGHFARDCFYQRRGGGGGRGYGVYRGGRGGDGFRGGRGDAGGYGDDFQGGRGDAGGYGGGFQGGRTGGRGGGGRGRGGRGECYNCGEVGHFARDCQVDQN